MSFYPLLLNVAHCDGLAAHNLRIAVWPHHLAMLHQPGRLPNFQAIRTVTGICPHGMVCGLIVHGSPLPGAVISHPQVMRNA